MDQTDRGRLFSRITLGTKEECWPWTGNTIVTGGYGALKIEGKLLRAHRLMYELYKGPPGDLFVLHKCNNPLCCNPSHLYLGLQAENARDAARCGALDRKLTRSAVVEILALKKTRVSFPYTEVAKKYGVSGGHVQSIWNGNRRGIA